MGVLHGLPVTKNAKQRRHFGHTRVAQNQAFGDRHEAMITQAFSTREHGQHV